MKRDLIIAIKRIAPAIAIIILLLQSPLFAQRSGQRPVSPAAVQQKATLKKKPYQDFKREPKVEIEEEEEEPAPLPGEADRTFFVKKINIMGNTIVSIEEIEAITQEHENTELSLNDLMKIANKITALYASKAHITTQAYVPPQRIVDQTVTIEIVEGEYGEFEFLENPKHTRKSIIEKRFKKRPTRIFNYNDLRNDILYLNQNPDRVVKTTMMRGKLPRTTDFKLTVKDQPPVHAGYEINNTGNKSTGLWRHNYNLKDTGLFLYDDNFYLSYIHSENNNLRGIAANYVIPVNEFGTKLGGSYSYFLVNIGHDFEDFQIKSKSTNYSFFMQHPIFDFNWLNGKLDAAINIQESRTEARPGLRLRVRRESRDRLRVLKTGLTLEESDRLGRSIVRNELSWAPENFLGSSDNIDHSAPDDIRVDPLAALRNRLNPSRPHADGTFVKYKYNVSRVNKLPFSSILLLNLQGQFTNNLLYGSEQHRIGGMYTVRGYAEGEALGDYGANASAEVRFPFHFIPEEFNIHGINPRRTLQGVGFVDWGFVHTKSSMNALGNGPQRLNDKLIGTGVGLRVNFLNCISGRLDLAWPIGNESSYGREPRLHMLFSVDEPTLQQYEDMLNEMMYNRIQRKLNLIAKNVPLDVVESYENALALEEEGRYEEAKELYVAVINRKNEIMTEAQTKIETAIKKEIDAQEYLKEANQLYKDGDYPEAREIYNKIITLKEEE